MTTRPPAHTDPNTEALEQMAAGDPDDPVIMVNLVKYRDIAAGVYFIVAAGAGLYQTGEDQALS